MQSSVKARLRHRVSHVLKKNSAVKRCKKALMKSPRMHLIITLQKLKKKKKQQSI